MEIPGLQRLPDTGRASGPGRARSPAPVADSTVSSQPRPHSAAGAAAPRDVWDRSAPRYRPRAIAFLVANWLLFCGLCIFAHWLHVAEAFDFHLSSYTAPLRLWGSQTQTLDDFVTFPINVTQQPVHAIVLGLTFASLVAIPISVAILYRFLSCLPFVLAIMTLAHLPWLGLTVIASCALASLQPFRLKFRYGAALIGLLPVVAYLFLASTGDDRGAAAFASPEERQMLVAPWIITILGACMMLAAILVLARLTQYRPGVITPIGALMFATPLFLFHRYVGADELSYRVLLHQWGPQSASFEPAREARTRVVELLHRWSQGDLNAVDPDGETFLGLWTGRDATRREVQRRIAARFAVELLAQRREAYDACKRFIARYPTSRYIPCVLYLQARTLDTRLSEGALVAEQPRRELYTDFPHVQSAAIWERLLSQYPGSPLSGVAALRLGQLRLRAGEVDAALRVLEQGNRASAPSSNRTAADPADARRMPELTVVTDFTSYAQDVQELIALIRHNRDDPQHGNAPLAELAALDVRRRGYGLALRELIAHYKVSRAFDDLCVRWALQQENPLARLDALETLVCRFRPHESFAAAAFYLGELEVLRLGRDDPRHFERGLSLLREVMTLHPYSPWAARAASLIDRMQPGRPVANVPPVSDPVVRAVAGERS